MSFDGTNAINNAPSYTLMDLFRYSAANVRQTTDGNPAYFSTDNGNHVYYYWNNPALAKGDLGDWAPSGPNGFQPTGNDAFLNDSNPGVVNAVSQNDLDLMNVLGWNLGTSNSTQITATIVANEYLAIQRTVLDPTFATSIANGINAGTETEAQYIDNLLVEAGIPAVAVEASMYGVTGTSAEITKLVTQFLPGQVAFAQNNGFNPQVVAAEALGLLFAFGNENSSTGFANNFGPSNPAMPNSTAGDATFAATAAQAIFGSASTANLVSAIDGYVTNWKAFYTSVGVLPEISHPTPAQIDLAARGAAWGDAVGVALAGKLGALYGQTTNFLEDAAQGIASYSMSLTGQPPHHPFQGET